MGKRRKMLRKAGKYNTRNTTGKETVVMSELTTVRDVRVE